MYEYTVTITIVYIHKISLTITEEKPLYKKNAIKTGIKKFDLILAKLSSTWISKNWSVVHFEIKI